MVCNIEIQWWQTACLISIHLSIFFFFLEQSWLWFITFWKRSWIWTVNFLMNWHRHIKLIDKSKHATVYVNFLFKYKTIYFIYTIYCLKNFSKIRLVKCLKSPVLTKALHSTDDSMIILFSGIARGAGWPQAALSLEGRHFQILMRSEKCCQCGKCHFRDPNFKTFRGGGGGGMPPDPLDYPLGEGGILRTLP